MRPPAGAALAREARPGWASAPVDSRAARADAPDAAPFPPVSAPVEHAGGAGRRCTVCVADDAPRAPRLAAEDGLDDAHEPPAVLEVRRRSLSAPDGADEGAILIGEAVAGEEVRGVRCGRERPALHFR